MNDASRTMGTWPTPNDYNEWLHDLERCNGDLRTDADRLFVSENESFVRCIDVGGESPAFEDTPSLATHLSRPKSCKLRILLIPQDFSWSELGVSEQMMRCMLRQLDAMPTISQTLHAFGERYAASSEGSGNYVFQRNIPGTRADFCYTLRCVEEHMRQDQSNPWSIRQFAVYDRCQTMQFDSTFLVINPTASQSLQRRLNTIRDKSTLPKSSLEIHAMFVSAAALRWNEYVNYLEQELHKLNVKARVDPIITEISNAKSQINVRFSDIQALYEVQEKIQQAYATLRANLDVVQALLRDLESSIKLPSQTMPPVGYFSTSCSNFKTQMSRVSDLKHRANTLANLMSGIMSFRTLDASRKHNEQSAKILDLAQQENDKASQDTKTLKTITILTLVYLPASFVATFLSMGYITIDRSSNSNSSHVSIDFKPEMIIFCILTIVLLFITIGLWLIVDRRRMRRHLAKKVLEMEGKDIC